LDSQRRLVYISIPISNCEVGRRSLAGRSIGGFATASPSGTGAYKSNRRTKRWLLGDSSEEASIAPFNVGLEHRVADFSKKDHASKQGDRVDLRLGLIASRSRSHLRTAARRITVFSVRAERYLTSRRWIGCCGPSAKRSFCSDHRRGADYQKISSATGFIAERSNA
jgi:hypothetical protein